MKKTYIIPVAEPVYVQAENMIAASITQVGGDAQIEIGEGEAPATADVKVNPVEWEDWD